MFSWESLPSFREYLRWRFPTNTLLTLLDAWRRLPIGSNLIVVLLSHLSLMTLLLFITVALLGFRLAKKCYFCVAGVDVSVVLTCQRLIFILERSDIARKVPSVVRKNFSVMSDVNDV